MESTEEKVDELVDKGTLSDQTEIIVTHSIIKKQKNRKWEPTHERARATYIERRKPKDIEKSWPKHVRSAYAKLRTGNSKDLREYRHRGGSILPMRIRRGRDNRTCNLQIPETRGSKKITGYGLHQHTSRGPRDYPKLAFYAL